MCHVTERVLFIISILQHFRFYSIEFPMTCIGAAKQAALVWACAAKRWWWLGRNVWSMKLRFQDQGKRPKRIWREVVREDCQAHKLNKENAMDRCKWRKMIKDVRWSGWVWVGECFFWYRPTRVVPDKKGVCVCVRACVRACVCIQRLFVCNTEWIPSNIALYAFVEQRHWLMLQWKWIHCV